MQSNIHNNNIRGLKIRCIYDEYYDFMLSNAKCYSGIDYSASGATCISPEGVFEDKIYSNCVWDEAVNRGIVLTHIGFTGIDNGLIRFEKDRISNKDFIEILTGSTLSIPEQDKRLCLSPVTGNTMYYNYPMSIEEEEGEKYFSFRGGFYQGFYKLFGYDYEVLPSRINDEWNLSFELRPRSDYKIEDNTINEMHTSNTGIFFYMGARAENKFWHFYPTSEAEDYKIPSAVDEGYFEDWDLQNYITDVDYLAEEEEQCQCTPQDPETNYSLDTEYWAKDVDLTTVQIYLDGMFDIRKKGYYEVETDNKFILFNRTENGFDVNTWEEGDVVILTGRTDWDEENYYTLFNRTETGLTVPDIDDYREAFNVKDYSLIKDIKNNAFCLKINEDNSIGYRYCITDCDSETGYSILEEKSKPNIIKSDEWNKVNVKFKILNGEDKCGFHKGQRKMKIYFYVNNYLIFISKELNEFNFRELNDIYQKQEGVPYNISLGGGTQGLMEEIQLQYYLLPEYLFPLEKYFGGSFLGDIKSFNFYPFSMDFASIKLI